MFEIETKQPGADWKVVHGPIYSEATAMKFWRCEPSSNGVCVRLKKDGVIVCEKRRGS